MTRIRLSLILTLLPLILGAGGYYYYWTQERNFFAAQLADHLDHKVSISGFPYRLESDGKSLDVKLSGSGAVIHLQSERAVFSRTPFSPSMTVARLEHPKLHMELGDMSPGITLDIAAANALVSLRREGDHIARLSIMSQGGHIMSPLLPGQFQAGKWEAHLRETPQSAAKNDPNPTPPAQIEIYLTGENVLFGGVQGFTLKSHWLVTAPRPIHQFKDWRTQGTVELKGMTLSDAQGEIFTLSATVVPHDANKLVFSGVMQTVCPRGMTALLTHGVPPANEQRARRPAAIALEGITNAPQIMNDAPTVPRPTKSTSAQKKACPHFTSSAINMPERAPPKRSAQ